MSVGPTHQMGFYFMMEILTQPAPVTHASSLPLCPGLEQRRDACWKRIVDEKTLIPAHSIKLYDPDGNKTGRLLYSDHTVTLECTSSDPLGTSEPEASATITPETPVCDTDAPSTMEDEDSETSTVDVPPMEQEDNEV